MQSKTKTIFDNCDFTEFTTQICDVVNYAIGNFWEQDNSVLLQAVNDFREIREEKIIANIDFFSSQIKVENHRPIIVRLSKDFVETILKVVLKQNRRVFDFTKITPLEVKILNAFCEFLYRRFREVLIPVDKAKLSEKSDRYVNLIFLVAPKNENCTKIMISVPQDRIAFIPLKKKIAFKDEDFLSSKTSFRVRVGSSKITIDDLQHLSVDDIVILDNSELSKLTLLSGDVEQKFNVEIDPSLVVDLSNDEENQENIEESTQTYNEVTMNKNLWDDIEIEINAEFEKVKMTIGELKQITQGQIVDLGSVFDNEVSLYVEDRKVAKGELIIINDRYAVRLNEVLNSEATNTVEKKVKVQPQAQPQPKPAQPKPQPQPQAQARPVQSVKSQTQAKPNVEDEEFDYSDFEK